MQQREQQMAGQFDPLAIDMRVRQFEAAHDMLHHTLDGWCVWPLLRFQLYRSLQRASEHEPETTSRTLSPTLSAAEVWSNRARLLVSTATSLVKLAVPPHPRYLVLVYPSNRRSEQRGMRYEDIFYDQLLLDIGHYFKLEERTNTKFLHNPGQTLIKSDLTTTPFIGYANILARRLGGPRSLSLIAEHFSRLIQRDLNLSAYTKQKVEQVLLEFFWQKRLYTLLLRRLNPAYLFLTVAYTQHAIIAAAREQHIRVIEFQHGTAYAHHPGFSWTEYGVPYKPRMPLPERIFLYGDYWRQELQTNGFWQDELYPVGSLRIDQYRARRRTRHADTCTIIFTTQSFDTERMLAFLAEFVRLASQKLNIRLFIKLHPIADSDRERYLAAFRAEPAVRVVRGDENPSTFELLCEADLHISISSTCHYEALALDVPTVILPFASHEIVLHLYQSGHALLVHTPHEMLNALLQRRGDTLPADVGAFYFKPAALENMKQALMCG